MLLIAFWYFPKWQMKGSNAVLTTDASGYYFYLPAIFIYHDVQELRFRHEVLSKYAPTSEFDQAFRHAGSGHFVMKYSAGLALQELPFFLVAHLVAANLGYPDDGFSEPYQFAIQLASILVAILALFLVRRALLPRFGEWPTTITLLLIVLGTNYLDYSALQGAMTHNWLFLWYAVLGLLTPTFYRRPTLAKAVAIGGVVGLMTLTRPTDILAVLVPLLWGLAPTKAALRERLAFWRLHVRPLIGALVAGAAVVSIQLLYWHYVSGDWVVYSYGDQGFSWLKPHLWEGIFSFKSGWLMYSPLLLTALVGFGALRKQQFEAFWPIMVFIIAFTYVAFAWDEWTYGGSLGQRAMVQTYALLAWPMAAALQWLFARPRWAIPYALLAVLGCYYNLWLTYQAHVGGLLVAGQMTRTYLWRVIGRYHVPPETRLLLDTNSEFTGTPLNERVLWQQDFEQQDSATCGGPPLQGRCSLFLDKAHPHSAEYIIAARPGDFEWVKATAEASVERQEWSVGHMTQYVVQFRRGNSVVKQRTVHLQRALEPGWPRELHFYMRPPEEEFDNVCVKFLYFGTQAHLLIDNARLQAFND